MTAAGWSVRRGRALLPKRTIVPGPHRPDGSCHETFQPPIATRSTRQSGDSLMAIERKVVAVVDDDPSMLKAIERLLRVHGFDAAGFTSAEAFLGCDAASAADCLVLDIHLGGMSG